jgi:hypothetical protein
MFSFFETELPQTCVQPLNHLVPRLTRKQSADPIHLRLLRLSRRAKRKQQDAKRQRKD